MYFPAHWAVGPWFVYDRCARRALRESIMSVTHAAWGEAADTASRDHQTSSFWAAARLHQFWNPC